MELNPIAIAIPVFLVTMVLEWALARRQGLAVFRFHDTVTDLSCGILNQVFGVFVKGLILALFVAMYERFHLFELSATSALTWLIAMVGVDFAYYWWHRAAHRINALWAIHVVHHQSEDYNLAVALRQAWFSYPTQIAFYLPLVILGVPPLVVVLSEALNTLYQFWIHTRLVRRIGPLESVLNTASHHRVHHGINPRYIDKNYGGILIVWDRLFGTFEPEGEQVVYGTVTPLRSWNPVWANFSTWRELVVRARRARRFSDKVRIFLGPPEWHTEEEGGVKLAPEVTPESRQLFDTPWDPRRSIYIAVHLVLVVAVLTGMLLVETRAPVTLLATLAALVVWATASFGFLSEGRAHARGFELARLAVSAGVGVALVGGTTYAMPASLVILCVAMGSVAAISWIERDRNAALAA